MDGDNQKEQSSERPDRLSAVLNDALSIIFQIVLFFCAAAAIALFYLSYRPGDFLQSLIVTGLLMLLPWFIISLLPTLFGLHDKELKYELLAGQLLCLTIVLLTLLGLAFSINYHPALIDLAVNWMQKAAGHIQDIWNTIRSFSEQLLGEILMFVNKTIVPIFSR